jgi:hypothetical protein
MLNALLEQFDRQLIGDPAREDIINLMFGNRVKGIPGVFECENKAELEKFLQRVDSESKHNAKFQRYLKDHHAFFGKIFS